MEQNQIAEDLKESMGHRRSEETTEAYSTLASEADHLETAVAAEAEPESAHGPDALRAEEAWDATPGDSEASVDYPDAGYDELSTDLPARPALKPMIDIPLPDFAGYGVLSTEPELAVDVCITTPDGRSWTLNMAHSGKPTDAEILAAINEHFDSVSQMLGKVFAPDARRAALGLAPKS